MARHKIKVDSAIKAAKPMPTMYRLNDGGGLHHWSSRITPYWPPCGAWDTPGFHRTPLAHAVRDPNGRAFNRIAHRAEVVPLHSQLA